MGFFITFNFVTLCQAASSYRVMSKQVENGIFRHKWIYRHTCMRKQPHWQSSGIIIFLCKYYIIISNTLGGSLFDVLFLFLPVVLSEFHKKPRRNKEWVTEKSTWKNFCEGHHFLRLHASLSVPFFVTLFVYSLPFPKWHNCWMAPIKIHNNAMGGILCVVISWVNGWKYENLLQINTS